MALLANLAAKLDEHVIGIFLDMNTVSMWLPDGNTTLKTKKIVSAKKSIL